MSKRIEWVDMSKGIGIILVILAHTSLDSTWLGKFINSFHMPLFFFLSGFFFSPDKYSSFSQFAKKKASTLLLPYFIFAAGSFIYFIARYTFGDAGYYKDLSLYQQFAGILYSAGTRQWMDFNIPLWFLTCLFTVEIMFYMVKQLYKTRVPIVLALIACSLAGYLDGGLNPYKLPWGMDVALTAIVFFGVGYLLKAPFELLLSKPAAVKLALAGLFLILNLVFIDQRVNLNMKVHGHYYDFYIAAFSGIAFCTLFASMIRRSKVLNYLGYNALILMAVHMPLLNLTTKILNRVGFAANPYTVEVLRVILTVLLAVPIIYVINRYFPFILGRANVNRSAQNSHTLQLNK